MTERTSSYAETSVPVGAAFVLFGFGVLISNYYLGIFTDWTWAVIVGGLWAIVGALFFFSDIRLYQFDQSPLEQLREMEDTPPQHH